MRVFGFALFGGFAVNFLRLFDLLHLPRGQRPETVRDWLYVTQFLVLPILGGGLAYAYQASGTSLSPILAVNIGASAPAILKSFASVVPHIGPAE
ncbi:MAG: hypothetical protein DMG25_17795 [Acidobacteria bacterium]|nr:MAG: hypothetical protein DMG25_17795 [Acidobacteriota bacterium]PYV25841.1 MAG: hypothetical protein DMG27_08630 [Acidobacteriota bacterium]